MDVDDVTVRYDGASVLDSVSFCVHQGEFVGLIGPNGAGKTTLLKVILKLLPPSKGEVRQAPRSIGYIPQRGALYSAIVPISVLEVVKLGSHGSTSEAIKSLGDVGMAEFAKRRFNELSSGQQQRVSIAKALASNADVLLLDEPTTGIDERAQKEFYALLRNLRQRGITILMVSHEVDTVLKLVTRVICLNQTILYDGPPEHFEADKYLPQAYQAQHRRLHHQHGGRHA